MSNVFRFLKAFCFCCMLGAALQTLAQSSCVDATSGKRGNHDIRGLYVKVFGDRKDPAIIYLHGGPGGDSQKFEITEAEKLSQEGFFVLSYDQRGQGRSESALPEQFTYSQYADDLKTLIERENLKHPTLMAHSHGGAVALSFDQKYPGVADKIILVSAPVDFARLMPSIYENCLSRFKKNGDTASITALNAAYSAFKTADPHSEAKAQALSQMFYLAMTKGNLYTPSHLSDKANKRYRDIEKKSVKTSADNQTSAVLNFSKNEDYISVDRMPFVREAKHIYGIYGAEDGLFTPQVLADIQAALSANPSPWRFQLIDEASHSIFVDRRGEFNDAVMRILKP